MVKVEWVGGPYDGGHTSVPPASLREGYLDIVEPVQIPRDGGTVTRTIRLRVPIHQRKGEPVLSWEGREVL